MLRIVPINEKFLMWSYLTYQGVKMSRQIFTLAILFITAFISLAFSQNELQLDPSQVSFHATDPPNAYDADSPVRVSIRSSTDWSISCIAEVLAFDGNVIPLDRTLIKKEGEEFQPMITAIHIGSGGSTGGAFQEITILYFKVDVLETDMVGTYQGSVKFFDTDDPQQTAIAVLPMTLVIDPFLNFDFVEQKDININISGEPGIYAGDDYTTLSVNGNTSGWKMMASFEGCQPPGYFFGENFYINSSAFNYPSDEGAGSGYQKLGYKREILNGTTIGTSGSSDLNFKVKTNYQIPPDTYTAQINIDCPEFSDPKNINLIINVSEYLTIELSHNEVMIESAGPEGEYEADEDVILKVASNTDSWEARAQGENLKSIDDEIPSERVYLYSSNQGDKGFMSMNEERVVASGTKTELAKASTMKIKVKTTWEDRAGEYSGKVYFTVIAIP